jgi:hypothetical protein
MTLWLFSTGQPWLAFSDIAIMRFLNCFTGPGSIWQTLQNILNLSKRFSLCGHSHHVWHIKQTHVLKCLEDHFMGSMWIEMDQPDSGNLGSDWCPLSSTVHTKTSASSPAQHLAPMDLRSTGTMSLSSQRSHRILKISYRNTIFAWRRRVTKNTITYNNWQ